MPEATGVEGCTSDFCRGKSLHNGLGGASRLFVAAAYFLLPFGCGPESGSGPAPENGASGSGTTASAAMTAGTGGVATPATQGSGGAGGGASGSTGCAVGGSNDTAGSFAMT